MVFDQPGGLAEVCRVLADQRISISSVVQHEAKEGQPDQLVPLVIVTHYAETGKFRAALKAISQLTCIRSPAVSYSVDD
jgi:homoserine dehydrogenase